jgi:hypothetical protein
MPPTNENSPHKLDPDSPRFWWVDDDWQWEQWYRQAGGPDGPRHLAPTNI